MSKYPDRDFLESTSLAIYASVYTSNTGFSPPKHKYALEVPLRYLRIYFTVIQCSLLGLERNRLTTLIACAISGFVQTMVKYKCATQEEGELEI